MINVDIHERRRLDFPEDIPPFRFKSSVLSNKLGAYIAITDSTHCDVTIYFRTCETIALFREALAETEELLGSVGGKPYKVTNRLDRLEQELEASRAMHRECRIALGYALAAANAPACKECDGTGDGIRFGAGGPNDETPPEIREPGGCDDCEGLGLEWI